jgi:hypothetical protein
MNHIRLRTRQSALCPLSAFLLTVCIYLAGMASANSQIAGGISTTPRSAVPVGNNISNLQFSPFLDYDAGVQSSIALNVRGIALEFHRSQNDNTIWYRVGKMNQPGYKIILWGKSQTFGAHGYWPAVALSKEGYVIEVHSDRQHKSGSQQFYRVGKIDHNGDQNQSIIWKTGFIHWDGGFHTSIAINNYGFIVGVHESNAASGTGLYYRVGKLNNPAGDDYTIAWSSGSTGVKYDDGINPHIAINYINQVVEVHQVTGESLLHYRRGTISEGKIHFAESQRYDNNAEQPAVALLGTGRVLELQCHAGRLYSRTGDLDPSNSTFIDWTTPLKNGDSEGIEYPALANVGSINVRYAFHTHVKSGFLNNNDKIYFSSGDVHPPSGDVHPNGSAVP